MTAAQLDRSELEAIVEEARCTNLYIATHPHGPEGILGALKARLKAGMNVKHGSYLAEEVIDMMKEKEAILCATRLWWWYFRHNRLSYDMQY